MVLSRTIRPIMTQVVALQAGLEITSPVRMKVQHAYPYWPDEKETVATPCFMNEWSMMPIDSDRMISQRDLAYLVRHQFLAGKAGPEDERLFDVATEFWEQWLEVMGQHTGLNGTATQALLRGAQPTMGLIPRGEVLYVGFEAFLDIKHEEAYLWKW